MSPCPDLSTLDDLSAGERSAHLAECEACNHLFTLRNGGNEEFSEACESAEMLLAIASEGDLDAPDEERLTHHLATCDRCTGLAGDLLLARDQSEALSTPAPVWKHARDLMSATEPANDQRHMMALGLGVLAAAALLFVILGGGDGDSSSKDLEASASQETDSITVTRALPSDSDNNTAGQDKDKDEDKDKTAVGAPSPEPTLQPPTSLPATMTGADEEEFDTVLKQAQDAITNTQYGKGLKLAKMALNLNPGNQDALFAAAIAACNLMNGPAAKRFLNKVKSAQRRRGLMQICMRLKVPGFVDGFDDDVDKLVEAARTAIKNTQYGKGLKLAKYALDLKPGNQSALYAAAIAACNLRNGPAAKRFLDKVKSAQRRRGLFQICARLNVPGVAEDAARDDFENDDDEDFEPDDFDVDDFDDDFGKLLRAAQDAIKNTRYGKGLKLAKRALELKPRQQNALYAAAIAACNLMKGEAAKRFIKKVDSSQRRRGLKQVCARLNAPGF